jgi:hypothetical protein
MTKIEKLRKRPVEVETMLWDGTDEAAAAIQAWVGAREVDVSTLADRPASVRVAGEPGFQPPGSWFNPGTTARLYVAHNGSWSPLPVGYRVARELDGSGFYPLSPEGAAAGYEMPGGDRD